MPTTRSTVWLMWLRSLLPASLLTLTGLASAAGTSQLEFELVSIKPIYFNSQGAHLKFRVRNPGTETTLPANLKVLLSADDRISSDDSVLFESGQDALRPKAQRLRGWQVQPSAPTRDYWLFICGEWEDDDQNAAPMCSEAFAWPAAPYDLLVTSLQVAPERLIPGNSVAMRVMIKNDGSAATTASRVHFKVSSNETLSPGDSDLVVLELEPMTANQRVTKTAQAPLDLQVSTYWIGACIEAIEGERSTDNNCSFPVKIEVVENRFPDLVVDVVRVRPDRWALGEQVDFYAEVLNIGNADSSASKVRFYLSEDGDVDDEDMLLGTAELEGVNAESIAYASLFVDPSTFPGVYWLGACVEPDDTENEVFNNCMTGPSVEIIERGLDLH